MAWGTPINIGNAIQPAVGTGFIVTNNVPAGSLIVVVVGTLTLGTPDPQGVFDTQSNTYHLAKTVFTGGSSSASIYYAYNVTALTSGVDFITVGDNDALSIAVSAMCVTGTGAVNPFDSSSDNSATGSSDTPSVTSFSPIGAGELFVGYVTAVGDGIGWTDDITWTYLGVPASENTDGIGSIPESTVNAGSGTKTYSPFFTSGSLPWTAVIASFRLPTLDPDFRSRDWPNPQRRRVGLNVGYTNSFKLPLTLHHPPQQQFDWPNPRAPRQPRPDWSQPATLLLSAPPPELPASRKLDWPNPTRIKPLVQDWLQTSTVLASAPPPELPASRKLDWPNPNRAKPRIVPYWIMPSTWVLSQAPPVISMARNRDWPVPRGRRGSITNFTLIDRTFLTPPEPQGPSDMLFNKTGRVRYLKNEVGRVYWLAKN